MRREAGTCQFESRLMAQCGADAAFAEVGGQQLQADPEIGGGLLGRVGTFGVWRKQHRKEEEPEGEKKFSHLDVSLLS